MSKIQKYLLFSFFLLIFSLLTSQYFISFSIYLVSSAEVKLVHSAGHFSLLFNPYFILSITLLPELIWVIIYFTGRSSIKDIIMSTGIMLLSAVVFWSLRMQYFILDYRRLEIIFFDEFGYEMPIESIKSGKYFALGIFTGFLISLAFFYIFRKKKESAVVSNSNHY